MKKRWGSYKVIAEGRGYKVKILTVKPGGATSVQRHFKRGEVWVRLTNSDTFNECRIIRKGQVHQLKNDGKKAIRILEVQFGEKCVEKDIERMG